MNGESVAFVSLNKRKDVYSLYSFKAKRKDSDRFLTLQESLHLHKHLSDRLLFLFHYTSVQFPSSCFVPLPGQSLGRVSVENAHCAKASLGQTRSIHAGVRWFPAALSGCAGLTMKYWIWNSFMLTCF